MSDKTKAKKSVKDAFGRPTNAERREWFRMEAPRNEADGSTSADVYVYDVIDSWFGVSAQDFAQQIAALDVDQINLRVNSPGGNVFDATAMTNALSRHPAHVVATVDGIAASAASFLITAANEVIMGQGSTLMIHDAWSIAMGSAQDMRDQADILDKLSDNIASLYANKAGGTAADWRAVMLEETWYSADEAVEAGLADSVDAPAEQEPTNQFDLSVFAHAGRKDAPKPPIDVIRAAAARHPAEHLQPAALLLPETPDDVDLTPPAKSLTSASAGVTVSDRPTPTMKGDASMAPAATEAEPQTETPAASALTATDISNLVRDELKEFLASVPTPASSPGIPASFKAAPKEEKGLSYSDAMNLFSARARGLTAPEARKAVEDTLTNASEVFAALTNVSLADATSGGLVNTNRPQWIGELITKVPFSGLWDLIAHEDLTAPSIQAFVMQTAPTGGTKGDGGAAVTSTGVKWVLQTTPAGRFAGADSFDRTVFDFGLEASAFSSYFRVQLRNYYLWRDALLIAALSSGITPYSTAAIPSGSSITAITNKILDGVGTVLNQGGGIANIAAVSVADFTSLLKNSQLQAPAFITLDLGALSEGNVEGKITIRPDLTGTITTATVMVANGEGVTGYELPGDPVRAEQVQVSIGNIDVGLFGYAQAIRDSANYVTMVTT